jgi:hypothetical protein
METNKTIQARSPHQGMVAGLSLLSLLMLTNVSQADRHFRHRHPPVPVVTPTPPAPPPAGVSDPDCSILIPKNPLTAQGLATPYQLFATFPQNGPCHELDPNQSAFVQAAIIDPATGAVSVYNPVVVDSGTAPAVAPVVPVLPPHAIVAIWFGYNGNNLTQVGNPRTLEHAHCVNGDATSIFGQYSYCNAPAFFAAANAAIASGQLVVPPLGKDNLGLVCPSVRDFFIVDQDQSDNLPVTYLKSASGQIAQNNPTNAAALAGSVAFGNPSDNGLTDRFMDPAIGCTPWKVTDLAFPAQTLPALALNELQARSDQMTPVADVPVGDPMVLDGNGNTDLVKTNLYRQGTDQPLAWKVDQADTARYCRQMLRIAPPRLIQEQAALMAYKSPVADAGNNLFTFMMGRFMASYVNLNCQALINLTDPVNVVTDGNGVPISGSVDMTVYNADIAAIANLQASDDAADKGPDILKSTTKGHHPFHGGDDD